MRVAVVTESFLPTINGVTNSVKKVLDHLALRGHEAIVICPAADAPESYAGFKVHQVPAVAVREFPVGLPNLAVQRILDDFAPDVLHAASPVLLGGHAILAAKRRGIPAVAIFQTDIAGYTARNGVGLMRELAWSVLRYVHNQADRTLAPSTASIRDLARNRIERVERWGRGVDLQAYHPQHRQDAATRRLRAELAPNGETVIGYVGRLAPEKQVERLAQLRGLPGIRIAFDVFVHTGTEETFGQTLQEAHATGLPVVAPLAGGPIDLITHGTDGYLFDPSLDGGPDSMRNYIERLVENAPLRARMGEAGRRRVLDRSWESVCDELVDHYRAVCAPAAITTAAS